MTTVAFLYSSNGGQIENQVYLNDQLFNLMMRTKGKNGKQWDLTIKLLKNRKQLLKAVLHKLHEPSNNFS